MGNIQAYIDNVVPADMQGTLTDRHAILFMYSIGKALSERNISSSTYTDHTQEIILQPGSGKVTVWQSQIEYKASDVVTHGGKRYVCCRDHGNAADAAEDETPGDANLHGFMTCVIPSGTITFDVVTGLTVPDDIDIQKTGVEPVLDSNLLVYLIDSPIVQHAHVIENSTQLTVTLTEESTLHLQRKPAWQELSLDDHMQYLHNYKSWINTYIANLNNLKDWYVDSNLDPVVLDAAIADSDGYLIPKFDWLVDQLQKLTWIDYEFGTWFKLYSGGSYVQSTPYIDGVYAGSDTVSYSQGDIFRTGSIFLFAFGGSFTLGSNSITLTSASTGYMRIQEDIPASQRAYYHRGQGAVREFDLQFDITGEGRVQIGPLHVDFTSSDTRIWWPEESDREESDRYYYKINSTMTAFRAIFDGSILSVYVNAVLAVTLKTDYVSIPFGRFNSYNSSIIYKPPFEVSADVGEELTVSNFSFSRTGENLTQVKQKWEKTDFSWIENLDHFTYSSSYYSSYTFQYPINTDEFNTPIVTIGTPSVETGDLVELPFLNGNGSNAPFFMDGPDPYGKTTQLLEFKVNITCWMWKGDIEGSGPYSSAAPFSREDQGSIFTSFIYFPVPYPKCPNPYTAVVYAKAKHSLNKRTLRYGDIEIIIPGDDSYDWGITGILTEWIELARVAVPANTKGDIDVSSNFTFPTELAAQSYSMDDNDSVEYNLWNDFEIKLIMEMNYDYS